MRRVPVVAEGSGGKRSRRVKCVEASAADDAQLRSSGDGAPPMHSPSWCSKKSLRDIPLSTSCVRVWMVAATSATVEF